MKLFYLFIISTFFCEISYSQNSENNPKNTEDIKADSTATALLKEKKSKQTTARLIRERDSLLKQLAIEQKFEAEQIKNKLPRTDYYTVGENGIELIAKQKDIRVVISLYDSKPTLKGLIANELFELYNNKNIFKDKILTINTTDATVTGLCKIKNVDKNTDISFYFQKIVWKSGLTEIHEGESFIAKPSSSPFLNPENLKKVVFDKK
ncbi:MAG: hypothetical protein RLZZ312_1127 [Bacteroidota bacterium]|jgi:hypothetical protein